MTSNSTAVQPFVIIVGAGLGGLMMALLLEKISVPYQILERAPKVKPLGSALSLTGNILPVFEQLGLLEEVYKIGKPCKEIKLLDPTMNTIGFITNDVLKICGYYPTLTSRPALYELMLSRVPAHKVLLGKKVTATDQDEAGVMVTCADGSTYRGDILVGADGAYSTVRSNLYKNLSEKSMLPASDLETFALGYISLVGITAPQDPEKYPELNEPFNNFLMVVGEQTLSWQVMTTAGNQICWRANIQLSGALDDHTQNAEWNPETKNDNAIKVFYDQPSPLGGTMGDLIDATPKEYISTVYLEEKFFETWHHKRIVLIGDACHKMLPAAGQGAINAMQDAVVLVNSLYDLTSLNQDNISEALQDYKDQRYPHAKFQFETSAVLAKLLSGQKWVERIMRTVAFNYLPGWVNMRRFVKSAAYRPQATFLPLVENRGSGHVLPQKPSRWYQENQQSALRSAIAV